MDDETRERHRTLGVTLFNRTWSLIDQPDRTPDDHAEMVLAATTSRWHWGQIGGPEEIATGDWQVAHVASLLGFGDLARFFAERNLAAAIEHDWQGWRLASAHEGMARACTVAGDAAGRAHHVARAREALDREPDAESRELIASQLGTIPDIV